MDKKKEYRSSHFFSRILDGWFDNSSLFFGPSITNTQKQSGIFITSIAHPEHGWPVAYYCSICRETVFLLSPWAEKPKDGDYWLINNICANEEHQVRHNMIMALDPSHKKSVFG